MYRLIFKRLFDFFLSLCGLICLSPVFLVLMILGRIKMKGNPFFYQERPGKKGKIFKLMKFRSMTEEKDKDGNYLPDEVRLTAYGKWLRNTSLDEIPELINILKGDMAIVGPRPLLVQYLPLYNEEQAHRHDVRPGLTGYAQVNGRFNLLWKEKLAFDTEYVKNITLKGDIAIILKTVKLVFEKDDVENEDLGSWYPFLGNDVEDQQTPLLKEKHKEIGSEFFDIPVLKKNNNYFPKSTRWFNSGRAALNFIIKDIQKRNKDMKTVALPSWCCDSMIEPFIKNGIEVKFYPVEFKNGKIKKKINIKADILFNMNYFGYENKVENFKGIVINDITQSVFVGNQAFEGDYVFGSLRKWAGFKTGGFAYCKKGFQYKEELNVSSEYIALRNDAMNKKKDYLNGLSTSKAYLDIYAKAEEMLDILDVNKADEEDVVNAKHIDVSYVQNTRQANARELLKAVKPYAIFKTIKKEDCPLFVPILVPNGKRDELRKKLISEKIYCPIHWPISSYHQLTEEEKYIYDNELSLVCDQRYSVNDMKKINKIIKEFLDGETTC